MGNIILASCLMVISTCIGFYFSKRYSTRTLFYRSINNFASDLRSEITFKRESIKSLLQNDYESEDFNKFISQFFNDEKSPLKFPAYLNDREKKEIDYFFCKIGKLDADTHLNLLDEYAKIFSQKLNDCETAERSYGVLYKKTGVIIGLIAFIIAV